MISDAQLKRCRGLLRKVLQKYIAVSAADVNTEYYFSDYIAWSSAPSLILKDEWNNTTLDDLIYIVVDVMLDAQSDDEVGAEFRILYQYFTDLNR